MNKYEQLQEFLNKCIELGWKPRNLINKYCIYVTDRIVLHTNENYIGMEDFGFHELFSKDSGLMEFVKWKYDHYSRFDNEKIIISNYNDTYELCEKSQDEQYHYIMMAYLNSEEKLNYFIENALLPVRNNE